MVRESALPDSTLPADQAPEGVRRSAFDQLKGMFEGYFGCGRKQKMDWFRHHNEGVNFKSPFPVDLSKRSFRLGK